MKFFNDKPKSSEKLSTNIAWAFQIVWRSGPGLAVANVILTFIQSLLPLISLYLIKLVIDGVSAGLTAADRTAAFQGVTFLIIISGGVVLFERIVGTLAGLVGTAQAELVTDRMYEILHAKSAEMDLEYYENSDYYDTLHRAQREAPYRPTRILNGLFSLGQSAISLIAIGGLLLIFHWSVPIFLILAAMPGLLIRFRFANTIYTWSRRRTPVERKAFYFSSMLTEGGHAKEIRLFNLGNIFIERFGNLRSLIRQERLQLLTKRSVADSITHSGAIVPAFALYGFLAYRALNGLVTIGDLVMFYQAVQRGQSYLQQFLGSIADLYENNLFLSNVHEFLSLKPKITSPSRPKAITVPLRQGIVFHGVKFQYPNSDSRILDAIDLRIRPGEHIALVGENGSGKTTLVKLLCRLYDPTEGAITVDGIDLRELSLEALRSKISIVFQDYARYHLTAKENIWFGNVELPPDEKRIVSAARQAGAHEAIAKLRQGYETVLGKSFENGAELSVGEWQKVALARAFLRSSEILILDEPTSAMDAKAEYELFKKFHQLSKGRTAILISHRLSTVKMVDHIYFLEHGTIVESGTHDELIDQRGKYAYMFERQAQNYR
jgi:ATP-binding cassette subfamily B protein